MRLLSLLFTLGVLAAAGLDAQTRDQDCQRGVAAWQAGDHTGAYRAWHALAEAGDAESQHNLGVMYRDGIGVGIDPARAVHWFRQGAAQGDAASQYNLAVLYDEGFGLPADPAEAARHYRLAADQGFPEVQFNLALAYEAGEGVARDI